MAPKDKRADTASETRSTDVSSEDVLKPFQEASNRFLRTNMAVQESELKERAKECLAFHDEVRKAEQAAYDAVLQATQKHVNKIGEQEAANPEQAYFARLQAQLDYEREVRQIYLDAQTKLQSITQNAASEDRQDKMKRIADQQQEAYQTYLADLQQAWAGTKNLDPQIMNAIASSILSSINR